jgi:hypothetical protein
MSLQSILAFLQVDAANNTYQFIFWCDISCKFVCSDQECVRMLVSLCQNFGKERAIVFICTSRSRSRSRGIYFGNVYIDTTVASTCMHTCNHAHINTFQSTGMPSHICTHMVSQNVLHQGFLHGIVLCSYCCPSLRSYQRALLG